MSEIGQHVLNKANLSGEKKMIVSPILESGQGSRKRKAKSEPLPGKRKRTEDRNVLVKRKYKSGPRLPRKNRCEGNKPKNKVTYSNKNTRCDELSLDCKERGLSNEENQNVVSECCSHEKSSLGKRASRKRKAFSDPLPAKRRRTENGDVPKVRRYTSSSKLLSRQKLKRQQVSRPGKKSHPQPKNNDCELSLDYGENDSLNEENRSLPGYSSEDSDFAEDVKNSEPPEYVKQLAVTADFANFEIGKLLGAGSFGEVVAATRKKDNVPVALKFVKRNSVSEYKKLNGRLIPAEVYHQRLARHRHVIKIYQLIFTAEYFCFVMERPEECKDLFDIIQDRNNENKPLTEEEVRRYFTQILEANIKCEDKGVVHRDIKPENILVDMRTDEAKLIDFGLASEIQREPFTSFRGTNQYMPPEYIKSRKYDGCQGTVWQMGILLVDMLSPLVTAFEKPQHALSMAPRVPQHFSPEVKNLIATLLNTTPDNRPTLKQVLKHPWFAMKN